MEPEDYSLAFFLCIVKDWVVDVNANMGDPVRAEEAGLDAPPQTRSGRVLGATTKVRDTARQLEDSVDKTKRNVPNVTPTASLEQDADRSSERPTSGGSGSDGTATLRKLVELVGESRAEVKWLVEAFLEQKSIIQGLQATNQELAQQLKETNERTTSEIGQLRDQLEVIATRVTESPQLSYADVARPTPSSKPSNIRTLSTANTTPFECHGQYILHD